jgi:hypothetical protein
MSNDSSDQYAPATVTSGSNTQYAAGFYRQMTIDITYTIAPATPSAQVQGDNTADCTTVGSTSAIKTFDAGVSSTGDMRFSFIDANEVDGDYCSQYTIEIYSNSAYSGSALFTDTIVPSGSPQGIITYTLNFSKIPKDTDLFWRVKVADTNPGSYGSFTNLTRGSGSSQVISKFRVNAGDATPPPSGGGGGNPNYASVTTFARNKFRVEFYQIADTITAGLELSNADANPNISPSFNPTPKKDAAGNWLASAIVHDAKKIGVSHTVNDAGEFFLTLASNHPQIGAIVPLRTFWRACRWDENAALFRVIGEGLVTETVSSPNEVIIYGIDKLGMLDRLNVPIDKTVLYGAYYTYQNFRLDQIHDDLLPAAGNIENTNTKTISKVGCVADSGGSIVTITTSAAHGYTSGDPVEVSGLTGANVSLNGTHIVKTTATTTTFTYTIPSKNTNITEASASGTVVVKKYTRHMFEPFQGVRKIYAGSTDVSNSPSSSTYRTVTETHSIMCDGDSYLKTLAQFADILMAGTTDVVIIENPNIGLPAANPNDLYLGIQYRHLKAADVPNPKFWMKYGASVKNFKHEPFQSKIASRASIMNYNYDNGGSSTSTFGVKSTLNTVIYDNYGLIEVFEKIDDERNDIEFAANLLYNRYPNQVLEFNLDVYYSQITPFIGYAVGDSIQVYLERRNVSVNDKFSLTKQEWIGNEDGSEAISFFFSPQQRATFKTASA